MRSPHSSLKKPRRCSLERVFALQEPLEVTASERNSLREYVQLLVDSLSKPVLTPCLVCVDTSAHTRCKCVHASAPLPQAACKAVLCLVHVIVVLRSSEVFVMKLGFVAEFKYCSQYNEVHVRHSLVSTPEVLMPSGVFTCDFA